MKDMDLFKEDNLNVLCILDYTEDTYPETLCIKKILGVYDNHMVNNNSKLLTFIKTKLLNVDEISVVDIPNKILGNNNLIPQVEDGMKAIKIEYVCRMNNKIKEVKVNRGVIIGILPIKDLSNNCHNILRT